MNNRSFDDLETEIRDLWDRADQIEDQDFEKARELTMQAHSLVVEMRTLPLTEQ